MRVLITATSLKPAYGGPASAVTRLASALAVKGADVTLWAADGSAVQSGSACSGLRRVNGEIDEVLRASRFDLVHDNGIWLRHNHRVAALAAQQHLPRIVSTHGMLSPWAMAHKKWKKRIAWRIYQRRDLDCASSCHVASAAEAQYLRQLALKPPILEISNGMDVPEGAEFDSPRPSRRERTALFLGRIYPVKGLPMLVDAWARIRPQGWRLIIAGPDEAGHRADIETRVAAAGLVEQITFAGELVGQAKTSAFLDAHLFILPSHSESFGMAIAEALAHGLPVLTTRGAPWPQLMQYECGWWTPVSVDGIAQALCDATSREAEVLRQMGMRGRSLIRNQFGWDQIARRMLDTYTAVIERTKTQTTTPLIIAGFNPVA